MKSLLRFLTLAGAVAGAVWYARQRSEQQPAPATGEWTARQRLRAVPDPVTQHAADDLTDIKGIGPAYAQRLAELGITTFADLAAADAETLAQQLEARSGVDDWIAQAKERAGA